jgi:hypothetical protein
MRERIVSFRLSVDASIDAFGIVGTLSTGGVGIEATATPLSRLDSVIGCSTEHSGMGEKSGVGNHSMVRANRSTFDVPTAVQHFDRFGHGETMRA